MQTVIIDEEQCIGCSLCIPACPVDSIVGARKHMHTVLLDECIGCKLCVPACPVDCISTVPLEDKLPAGVTIDKKERADKAKKRYQARRIRLASKQQLNLPVYNSPKERKEKIQADIKETLARVKQKKSYN